MDLATRNFNMEWLKRRKANTGLQFLKFSDEKLHPQIDPMLEPELVQPKNHVNS